MDTPQQRYIAMPPEIAIELIHNFLEPGMPTLGMWFGWNQPNDTDTVKLGTVYGSPCEANWWEEIFDGATLDEKKDFIKLMRKYKKNPRDNFHVKGLWSIEEVRVPFSRLEFQDRMLYRLMTMCINTVGTDYHEWAIELGREFANLYYNDDTMGEQWELYEADNCFTSDFVDQFSHLSNITIDKDRDIDCYPEGVVEKSIEKLGLSTEWLEEYVNNFPTGKPVNFYEWMFRMHIENEHTWWMDDIDKVLVWFIDWMQKEWIDGNLELHPNSPSEVLNKWLMWVESQPLLPGFEQV